MLAHFQPDFRISALDICVLICGAVGSILGWQIVWWVGFVIVFVIVHFFLFCNVFRIARVPELIWAAAFVGLAGSTIVADIPGWIGTCIASLTLTAFLVVLEIKKPSYHGIGWQRWNPALPEWFESQLGNQSASPF